MISWTPLNYSVKLVCYPEVQKGEVTCSESQSGIQILCLLKPESVFSSVVPAISHTLVTLLLQAGDALSVYLMYCYSLDIFL